MVGSPPLTRRCFKQEAANVAAAIVPPFDTSLESAPSSSPALLTMPVDWHVVGVGAFQCDASGHLRMYVVVLFKRPKHLRVRDGRHGWRSCQRQMSSAYL